ncbi:hypothetical protein ACFOG5_06180 [Pedobacter fastidiosus]|uniref:Signal transduction histidine kinase n=1 Tax=Pedobacter fastidiosus TaxID=2765361 RepID=A0ABR7KXP1_9SPHI|nr:hypothetical protein [Pedobacter fastidiosus]MBC6112893.1 hypothetical protein [Pedobacter fastidiosus]
MLSQYTLESLIPIFAIGALLLAAIYHTSLFYFNREKLIANYTIYLWFSLSYMLIVCSTTLTNLYNTSSIQYILSTIIYWLSLLAYLKFILIANENTKTNALIVYKIARKTYLLTPIYIFVRFPELLFSPKIQEIILLYGTILDVYLFGIFLCLLYFLIKEKLDSYHNYIIIGTIAMLITSILNSITYYAHGYILGLNHISYTGLGCFLDVIFFSAAVGYKMRTDSQQKYRDLEILIQQQIAYEIEKEKAAEILLINDLELSTERSKVTLEQRAYVGRALHDDLSSDLAALKYLISNKVKKTTTPTEINALKGIEEEVNSIYEETRSLSHQLIENDNFDGGFTYDIADYLIKIQQHFLDFNIIEIKSDYDALLVKTNLTPLLNKLICNFIREVISNVVKFTNANTAHISIHFEQENCIIFIQDNSTNKIDPFDFLANITNPKGIINMETDINLTNIRASISLKIE